MYLLDYNKIIIAARMGYRLLSYNKMITLLHRGDNNTRVNGGPHAILSCFRLFNSHG